MYSIHDYGIMIADSGRMNAYAKALDQTVKPGSVVADIGTGTGIFALIACRLGARRVYAIEPQDAVQLAREIAQANGFADRIVFVQDLSTRITLPEPVDVIVSDLRGALPLYQNHVTAIMDARQRWLAPGGSLIPRQDTLWMALAENAKLFDNQMSAWNAAPYGLDLGPGQGPAANTLCKSRVDPEQLLTPPQVFAVLDYERISSPDVAMVLDWSVTRAGVCHGISVWFDALLADGISFSNAPGDPELIYGNAFLPWPRPVHLERGDRARVRLQAKLVHDRYIWTWDTLVFAGEQTGSVKADFRQSTFFGEIWSPEQLRKRASGYRPRLDEEGRIVHSVLQLMNSDRSLGEIAEWISRRFPERFCGGNDALTFVGDLAERYSQP
jgi:protein arginine N-methyltransferase 1